jgi:hypothetical protein
LNTVPVLFQFLDFQQISLDLTRVKELFSPLEKMAFDSGDGITPIKASNDRGRTFKAFPAILPVITCYRVGTDL